MPLLRGVQIMGSDVKIQTISVTPEQAKAWLKTNTLNRPVRVGHVKSLAAAMKRGEWTLNHQAIAMNGTKLLDGQHRLMALIQSGLPKLQMLVASEVPSEAFDTIDIGVKRSNSDIFREDKHVMNPISFIARIVYGAQHTPSQVAPIYEKLKKPMREIVEAIPRNSKVFGAAAIRVGILAAILSGEDKKTVLNTYAKMAEFELDGLPRVAQIFVKQIALTRNGEGRTVESNQRNQLLVRTYTAFLAKNSELQQLKVKRVEDRLQEIRGIFKDALGIQ